MNFQRYPASAAILVLLLFGSATSQTEDVRAATGLPIPIGQPVIYGQVTVRGLDKSETKPLVFVTLMLNGVQVDRIQTNDAGYYYFLRSPVEGTTILFEISNTEIGREVLTPGLGRTLRRDVTVDWKAYRNLHENLPGVISVKDDYPGRAPDASKELDKAMTATKAGKTDEAIMLYKQIVGKDPRDYVAWTELGTLFYSGGKTTEAEASYTTALEQKPDFMLALMNLGKLQMSQKQYDKAVQTFTKSIQTAPNSADAFHYLGESYLQIKQGSRAVIALNEAIRLAPIEKAEVHLRLATLYNNAGAKAQAVNEYKQFLLKKPAFKDKDKLEKYIKENS